LKNLAHPIRFERTTFAFGGTPLLAAWYRRRHCERYWRGAEWAAPSDRDCPPRLA